AAYLKKNWPAEWYEPAINAAQNFWVNEFKDALPLASPILVNERAGSLSSLGLDVLTKPNELSA
ncbi:hypothetical protein Alg130_12452, partial [Pyrenophora tritici-repentis]